MTRTPLRADRSALITGIGAVTPLGNDFDTIADALLDGRSGVVEIDGAGFSREARQFAAPVAAIPAMAADDSLDRLGRLCLAAAHAARADAGLFVSPAEADLFRRLAPEVAHKVHAISNGIDLETEIVAKLSRKREFMLEISVEYKPRTRSAGKKITATDGIKAILGLFRYRLNA